MHLPKRLDRAAFSLAEVMIVLLIIGLIAGLVGPAIFTRYQVARQRTAQTQIKLLQRAVDDYQLDLQEYPAELEGLINSSDPKWRGPYLKVDDNRLPADPWGNPYIYEVPGPDDKPYVIYSYGQDNAPGGEGLDADIYSWSEL